MIASTVEHSARLYESLVKVTGIAGESELLGIAASIRQPYFPGGILPVNRQGSAVCVFAPNRVAWGRLGPLLEARIGHTLSDFTGLLAGGVEPQIQAVLRGAIPEIVGSIRLHEEPKFRKGALIALRRLVENVSEHFAAFGDPKPQQSASTLLRAAETAFARADWATASSLVDELAARQYIDALNLRYLRVRVFAAAGDWKGLKESTLMQELQGVAAPREVLAALKNAQEWTA